MTFAGQLGSLPQQTILRYGLFFLSCSIIFHRPTQVILALTVPILLEQPLLALRARASWISSVLRPNPQHTSSPPGWSCQGLETFASLPNAPSLFHWRMVPTIRLPIGPIEEMIAKKSKTGEITLKVNCSRNKRRNRHRLNDGQNCKMALNHYRSSGR